MTRAFFITLVASALLAPQAIAQRAGCGETRTPANLPAAGALVDSARALADLAGFARSEPLLFSLLYNEDDSLPHVRPLDKREAIAAALLMRSLRPLPPTEVWAVRLRIAGGKSPTLTLERSIYCPPVPQETGPIGVIVTEVVPAGTQPPSKQTFTIKLEALVSDDGRPVVVRLLQPSGIKAMDDETVRDWEHKPFQPALIDGFPIQAVYRSDGQSPRL